MRKSELDIEKIFSQDISVPKKVLDAKENAILEICEKKNNSKAKNAKHKFNIVSVAAAVLIFVLLAGSGTMAATVYNRYKEYQSIENETMEKIYVALENSGEVVFSMNRAYSDEESKRYVSLEKEYKSSLKHPKKDLPIVENKKIILRSGAYLIITGKGEENVLHLPKRELKDEEILEIIDYIAKEDYVLYKSVESGDEKALELNDLFKDMNDDEVDFYWILFHYSNSEFGSTFVRNEGGGLSSAEEKRYEELKQSYMAGKSQPSKVITLIAFPDEYSGAGVAFCDYDNNYYLPDGELSDQDLLEIIDMKAKEEYVDKRVDEEVRFGYRSDVPKKENSGEYQITEELFSHTTTGADVKPLSKANVGDLVKLGKYEQDGNIQNGEEEIVWYVLSKEGKRLVLLSKDVLETKKFNEKNEPTTWAESDIRKWLNSEFLDKAFSEEERAMLFDKDLPNDDGVHSFDYAYLLSKDEAYSHFGIGTEILQNDYESYQKKCEYLLNNVDERIYAKPSAYVLKNGGYEWTKENSEKMMQFNSVDVSKANGNTTWWLRSFTDGRNAAFYIDAMGDVEASVYVNTEIGIRPAINVKVE